MAWRGKHALPPADSLKRLGLIEGAPGGWYHRADMIRVPTVAGQFYPSRPEALREIVLECLGGKPGEKTTGKQEAVAVLAPHAGYIFSGPCAGRVYASVRVPERVVVLCPNHTGIGEPVAVMGAGEWETPLGSVPVDESLARELMAEDPDVSDDESAHRREHSLEVQLPFLQVLSPHMRLVPLCVGTQRHDVLINLGDALARVIHKAGEKVLIVISSDMSHYISAERAKALDAKAISAMEALDPVRLHEVVRRDRISMCGVAPAVAGLQAARALGARKGTLVSYTNSGDRTGDHREVVAYAGLIFN